MTINVFAKSIKGLAVATVLGKKIEFQTVMYVDVNESRNQFYGIDNFGNVIFKIELSKKKISFLTAESQYSKKSKKLNRILSLPLKNTEFVNLVKFENQNQFEQIEKDGIQTWKLKRKKKILVKFSDFKKMDNGENFPYKMKITYKKAVFRLVWQNISN